MAYCPSLKHATYTTCDDFNRPTHVTDSRTGVTKTDYRSNISDAVASVTESFGVANRITAFTYDHRGRHKTTNAPDTLDAAGANLTNVTTTVYFPDGSVKDVSGGQTYHTSYTYDYARRMKTMSTYGTTSPAVTTWNYDTSTGQLTGKLEVLCLSLSRDNS